MKRQKQFLAIALTLLLLAACNKKPVDDTSSQNPPSSSPDSSGRPRHRLPRIIRRHKFRPLRHHPLSPSQSLSWYLPVLS
jgi:hypothetical protein